MGSKVGRVGVGEVRQGNVGPADVVLMGREWGQLRGSGSIRGQLGPEGCMDSSGLSIRAALNDSLCLPWVVPYRQVFAVQSGQLCTGALQQQACHNHSL